MRRFLFLLAILFISSNFLNAQQRHCSTTEYMNLKYAQNPALKAQFEAEQAKITVAAANIKEDKKRATKKKITVVVHIVHNSSQIGQGANIPDSVVYSQIDALNEDYGFYNVDSLPAGHHFKNIVAHADIEFCLAQKDQNGNPTTGITRHPIPTPPNKWDFLTGGSNDFDLQVKPSTIWDRTRYLNIWVCDLEVNTLGYATFPGMASASEDGVVICYKYFGWKGNAIVPPYDYGRTATHEVGHYLGLLHIWGDDDNGDGTCSNSECSGSDNVNDTPNQCERNYGQPATNNAKVFDGCTPSGNGVMYMNYMDYVDDRFMNSFTSGQKTRMTSTLNGTRSGIVDNGLCNWPTSISNNTLKNNIQVYPNPATDYVIVDTKLSNLDFNVTDVTGKTLNEKIFFEKIVNGYNLRIDNLSSGMYFINIRDGKSASSFKFSKK